MKNKKMIISFLFVILFLLIIFLSYMNKYKSYSKNYFYFDTYITIKVDTVKNKKQIDNVFDDIDNIFSDYHRLADRYNEYDGVINIYYLNEVLNNNEKIEIDSRLSDMILFGIDYYEYTKGLFNIASGNLTEIWNNFINNCDNIPNYDNINVNINIDDIMLDNNIYTKNNNIKLDLGGFAKGYVTELVGNYLEDTGIDNYIINAGGNVKVGTAYDKDNYLVGITNPEDVSSIFTKVNVNNLSVVTSGSYQRYCELDDKLYSHIINPINKYPSDHMKSVTVICDNSAICDIYSTYLFLLPINDGLNIINNTDGIEAIWYVDSDNIVRSEGFDYE